MEVEEVEEAEGLEEEMVEEVLAEAEDATSILAC